MTKNIHTVRYGVKTVTHIGPNGIFGQMIVKCQPLLKNLRLRQRNRSSRTVQADGVIMIYHVWVYLMMTSCCTIFKDF